MNFWVNVVQDEECPDHWNGWFPVSDPKVLLVTCGASRDEVLARAVDLADEWIRHCWENEMDPSQGESSASRPEFYEVSPSPKTQAAWMIRELRRSRGLTQTQAAKLIGISQQAFAKLENPLKSNGTLSTLSTVASAFGGRIKLDMAS